MASVEKYLVRDANGLILLLTPPFDRGRLDPGFIKGYVPGIRENGGQYTHAATWVVLATALLGQGHEATKLFDLLNPVRHAASPAAVERYKVEPYVVCADVYGAPPHTGRGGWTWCTGSASWLYRVGLEAILSFRLRGTQLKFDPCVPPGWSCYEITYRHRSATDHIVIENSGVPVAPSEAFRSMDAQCRRAWSNWWTTADSTRFRLCSGRNPEGKKSWKQPTAKQPEKNCIAC